MSKHAFPRAATVGAFGIEREQSQLGMTLREYAAVSAMRGLLANSEIAFLLDDRKRRYDASLHSMKLSLLAVQEADALLAALAVESPT
jgi:hypothetical protein